MPGAAASFIDALPGWPCIAPVNYVTYYGAKASASRPLLLGGLLTAGLDATAYADTVGLIYESPLRLLGGNYAGGIAVPFVWMEVKGQVQRIGPRGVPGPVYTARDTARGIGDVTLYPLCSGGPTDQTSSTTCAWAFTLPAATSGSNLRSPSEPCPVRIHVLTLKPPEPRLTGPESKYAPAVAWEK